MSTTFEEVVKLAEQLDAQQQNLLIYRLRVKQMQAARDAAQRVPVQHPAESVAHDSIPTRDALIREAETLRQMPPRPGDGLLGKYANPSVPDISEEEFHAQMHAIATEWEAELDEFYGDND